MKDWILQSFSVEDWTVRSLCRAELNSRSEELDSRVIVKDWTL